MEVMIDKLCDDQRWDEYPMDAVRACRLLTEKEKSRAAFIDAFLGRSPDMKHAFLVKKAVCIDGLRACPKLDPAVTTPTAAEKCRSCVTIINSMEALLQRKYPTSTSTGSLPREDVWNVLESMCVEMPMRHEQPTKALERHCDALTNDYEDEIVGLFVSPGSSSFSRGVHFCSGIAKACTEKDFPEEEEGSEPDEEEVDGSCHSGEPEDRTEL
eukprot:jgi/Mesvir1/26797/Mv20564-RA.1